MGWFGVKLYSDVPIPSNLGYNHNTVTYMHFLNIIGKMHPGSIYWQDEIWDETMVYF